MKNVYIIREGALGSNKTSAGDSDSAPDKTSARADDPDKIPLIPVGGKKKYLHEVKPEFFRWTGSRVENVFVGVCTIKDEATGQKIVVYSLPKYFPKERCEAGNLNEIKRVLKQICLVAEKLKPEHLESAIFENTDKFFEPYKLNREKNDVNRVELAEFLLEDYVQNGLYVNDITVTKKNGLGRTSWAKTVLKTTPIIQDGNIVYLDRINREHNVDEGDIIRKIHAEIIRQCLDLVGPLQPGGIVLDVDGMYDQDDSFDNKRECYAQEINTRIPYVFREREINLFKAMEAWCRNTKYYDDYIGVTHFDRLWEWVNDSVWGNISSRYTKSDNPKYYIEGCDGCFSGTGSAIPDTIRVETEDNGELCKKKVYVFDAKYYVLKTLGGAQHDGNSNMGEACGWPANSDIAKQIEYLELLKHLLQKANTEGKVQIEYKNAFLLPECTPVFSGNIPEKTREKFSMCRDDWYKKIGHVEQGKFNELLSAVLGSGAELEGVKARTVDLIIVKPEILYDYYLSGKKISSEELKCIWEDEKNMTLDEYLGQDTQGRRILVVSDMSKGQALLRNFEKKTGRMVYNVTCLTLDEIVRSLFMYIQARGGYKSEYELIDDTAASALLREVFREHKSSMQYLKNEKILNGRTTNEITRMLQLIRADGWKSEEELNDRLRDVLHLKDWFEEKLEEKKLLDRVALKQYVLDVLEKEDAKLCIAEAFAAEISYLAEETETYTAVDRALLTKLQTESDSEIRVFESQESIEKLEKLRGRAAFYKGFGTFNEMYYVANDILEKKLPLGDVIVLYSSPAQLPAIASAFAGNGIAMRNISSYSMQGDLYVSFVRNILDWAEDDFSEKTLERLLSGDGCGKDYFWKIRYAARRWEDSFVLGGGYARNRDFVEHERLLEEKWAAEKAKQAEKEAAQIEEELNRADGDMDQSEDKEEGKNNKKDSINIWDMHSQMLDIFADADGACYEMDAPVDAAEIYAKIMEFVKTYARKTAQYKDSIPKLDALGIAMKFEKCRTPYKEVFAYIRDFLDALTTSDSESADAVTVCCIGEWELLNRSYVYVTGLSLKDMQGSQLESPVLRDAELEKYLTGGYRPTIIHEAERKLRNLYRTLATFDGEQITFGYSDFDVNGFYDNSPSEFYEKNLNLLQGCTVDELPEFVYGNPTDKENYPAPGNAASGKEQLQLEVKKETSSSALEGLLACPKKYAYERKLYIPDREYDEIDQAVWLDAAGRGTFFHEIARVYVDRFLSCSSSEDCERDEGDIIASVTEIANDIKKELLKSCPAPYPELADKETKVLIDAAVEYLQKVHEEFRVMRWRALATEQPFFDAVLSVKPYTEEQPYEFIIKEGYIDRIDYRIDRDNGDIHLRIIDYKTGKKQHKQKEFEIGKLVQYYIYKQALMNTGKCTVEEKYDKKTAGKDSDKNAESESDLLLDYAVRKIRERESVEDHDWDDNERNIIFDGFVYVFPLDTKENRILRVDEAEMEGINLTRLRVILTALADKKMFPDSLDMYEITEDYCNRYGSKDSGLYDLKNAMTNKYQAISRSELGSCSYCRYETLCEHRKAGEIAND